MTLGNLVCAGCGTGNGGGVGCAGGKVGRNPTLPPAHPPLKGKKGGPPLSSFGSSHPPLSAAHFVPPPPSAASNCNGGTKWAALRGGWDDPKLLRGGPPFFPLRGGCTQGKVGCTPHFTLSAAHPPLTASATLSADQIPGR